MKVHKRKAFEIFDRLLGMYLRKEYPFNLPGAVLPQRNGYIPEEARQDKRKYALFLFAACYWMRGGIKSDTAFQQLGTFYRQDPGSFLPENAEALSAAVLADKLKAIGLGYNVKEISGFWKENLSKLDRKWKGDPCNLFAGISTYEEACDRIQNNKSNGFGGFQEKMVSMLTYFLMDAGLVDPWNFPVPVDFHVIRIVFANEILVAGKDEMNGSGLYIKKNLDAIRRLVMDYCRERDVDPLLLADALWLYSQLQCSRHPGNQSNVGGRHGRMTKLWPIKRWSEAQTKAYEETCGVCPLRRTCRWCVPSAEYYIRGRIILRERRDSPPQGNLFIDDPL